MHNTATDLASTVATYRFLGTTDECTECSRCGKVELRSTIMLITLDVEGNDEDLVYFGSSCAAKALNRPGKARTILGEAQAAHRRTLAEAAIARRMLAFYELPEDGEVDRPTLCKAQWLYARQHGTWPDSPKITPLEWRAMVLDMLSRMRSALADARLLGVV